MSVAKQQQQKKPCTHTHAEKASLEFKGCVQELHRLKKRRAASHSGDTAAETSVSLARRQKGEQAAACLILWALCRNLTSVKLQNSRRNDICWYFHDKATWSHKRDNTVWFDKPSIAPRDKKPRSLRQAKTVGK